MQHLFWGLGFELGTAPTLEQSILRVMLTREYIAIFSKLSNCHRVGQYPRFRLKYLDPNL